MIRAYIDGVIADADPEIVAADVGKKILALLAKDREPLTGGGHVIPGADERDKQRVAMAQAIEIRSGASGKMLVPTSIAASRCRSWHGPAPIGPESTPAGWIAARSSAPRSPTAPAISRCCLPTAPTRRSGRLHDAPEVFPLFTRKVSLPDFKPASLAGLGPSSTWT